jgi:hypothetical protein
MKQMVKDSLRDAGFNMENFESEYEKAIDSYNFEFGCYDAESHDDFWNYCFDNWS